LEQAANDPFKQFDVFRKIRSGESSLKDTSLYAPYLSEYNCTPTFVSHSLAKAATEKVLSKTKLLVQSEGYIKTIVSRFYSETHRTTLTHMLRQIQETYRSVFISWGLPPEKIEELSNQIDRVELNWPDLSGLKFDRDPELEIDVLDPYSKANDLVDFVGLFTTEKLESFSSPNAFYLGEGMN
ncbi:MAG: hypothetical protein KDD22_05820, partial [Bdellovibrionales bacterium]|nr:hypothetical protein [Bdellovibrionales bacterium]